MARLVAVAAAVLVVGCGSSTESGGGQRQFTLGGKAMAPCVLASGAGAFCGTLSVAENQTKAGGRRIGLRVAVIPAGSAPVAADPVFFIAGGPGGASSEDWSLAPSIFPGLYLHHDIVLVDQRGTGGSHKLELPPPNPGEDLPTYAHRVLPGLDGDPRYYTTAVAMDDLDAVRAALGYSKIDLYGGSYGATAVQYYLRQHGDRVRAAVLDGGTLLDVPIMELVAANSQRALDSVMDRCASDLDCVTAFPNLRAEFAAVMARLDRAPAVTGVIDPASGEPVVVTQDFFAGVIHSKLLGADTAAAIPWLIHRAAAGHFEDVAAGSDSSPTPNLVMSLEIRCTEAWARYDPAEVRRTGAGSYYMAAQLSSALMQAQGCPFLPAGYAPPDDAQPLHTSVPVLLLNGTADPQDPPSNVAGAPIEMPNSLEVPVPAQGHTVGHLGCLPAVVADFITTARVDAAAAQRCAEAVLPPPFQLA